MKTKDCHTCKKSVETAFRIQIKPGKTWFFVCEACLRNHQQKIGYRYGGTWKGYRH